MRETPSLLVAVYECKLRLQPEVILVSIALSQKFYKQRSDGGAGISKRWHPLFKKINDIDIGKGNVWYYNFGSEIPYKWSPNVITHL